MISGDQDLTHIPTYTAFHLDQYNWSDSKGCFRSWLEDRMPVLAFQSHCALAASSFNRLLHSHKNTHTSQSRGNRPDNCQQMAVLVLTKVSIIGARHNHYSWCVAVAELLMMQCLSGCACQVSLTTVWCEEEEHDRESWSGCWEIGLSCMLRWFSKKPFNNDARLIWIWLDRYLGFILFSVFLKLSQTL